MKTNLIFFCAGICLSVTTLLAQRVGIGTPTPHASALLELNSTSGGLLIPRMTSAQLTAIKSPAPGLLVYETTTQGFFYYNGSQWTSLSGGGGGASPWVVSGNNIYASNSGNVGINTQTPSEKLHIQAGNLAMNTPQFNGPYINLETSYLPMLNAPNNTGITFRRNGTWVGSVYYHSPNMISGNPNPIMTPGVLRLSASAAGANDLVIGSNGNVGINRYNPLHPLHVAGAIYTNNSLIINETSAILQLQSGGTSKGFMQLSGDNVRLGTNSGNTGEVIFRLNGTNLMSLANASSALNLKLLYGGNHIGTISTNSSSNIFFTTVGDNLININNNLFVTKATNRVGIGTNSPQQKLHVNGDTRLGGNVQVSGTITKTGNSNVMLTPLCFGKTNSWSGANILVAGSGNFTVEWESEGTYRINNNLITPTSTIIALPITGGGFALPSGSCTNGHCEVFFRNMNTTQNLPQDVKFQFVIYKGDTML